jgi:hypothetical protein
MPDRSEANPDTVAARARRRRQAGRRMAGKPTTKKKKTAAQLARSMARIGGAGVGSSLIQQLFTEP